MSPGRKSPQRNHALGLYKQDTLSSCPSPAISRPILREHYSLVGLHSHRQTSSVGRSAVLVLIANHSERRGKNMSLPVVCIREHCHKWRLNHTLPSELCRCWRNSIGSSPPGCGEKWTFCISNKGLPREHVEHSPKVRSTPPRSSRTIFLRSAVKNSA